MDEIKIEMTPEWKTYQNAIERLEVAIKLVAFHTNECANAVDGAAYYAEDCALAIKRYIRGALDARRDYNLN